MAYVPDIIDLKPFYIQSSTDTMAKDTTEWGLVPRVNPYPLLPTPKEPFKNEWFDEHGDDEWNNSLFYEAMEISVGFYVKAFGSASKTAEEQIREQIDSFFSYIRNGEFIVTVKPDKTTLYRVNITIRDPDGRLRETRGLDNRRVIVVEPKKFDKILLNVFKIRRTDRNGDKVRKYLNELADGVPER